MFLIRGSSMEPEFSFPRVSGDVSSDFSFMDPQVPFSPRERGCFPSA